MADLSNKSGSDDFKLGSEELRNLDEIARLCAGQGFYGKAAEAYQVALKKARQSLGENHRDVAQLHLLLAGAYRSLGEKSKATLELEQCLRSSQQALRETNLLSAEALNQLGMLAAEDSEESKAESFYLRSLDMLGRLGDKAKPTAAAVSMNLGLLYYHQGNRDKGVPLLERCLKAIEEPGTPETADTAQMLNTLAWVSFDLMCYEKAFTLARRSLKIRERILGPAHPGLVDSFDILAAFASKTGDYDRAIAWHKLSLSFREKALGIDHQSVADTLTDLSNAQDSRGDYAEALANCERALEIRQIAFGSQSHEVVGSLLQLAALKSKSFRESEALVLAQRAMEIEIKLHGADHPHVADCLDVIAATNFKLGKMPEAISAAGRRMEILSKTLGTDSLSTINAFESFALLGIYLGQDEVHHLKTALTRKEYLLGQENPLLVTSLTILARVYRERGRFTEADAYLQRALNLARRAWGDEHPETLAVRREILFLMLRQQAPPNECIEVSAQLLKSERAWISSQLLGLSHRDALTFLHPLISDQTILHSLAGSASGDGRFEANRVCAEQLALCKAPYEELLAARAKLETDSSTRTEELRERWHWLQSEVMRLPKLESNPGLRERRRRELQEKLSEIETELYKRTGSAKSDVFSRRVSVESLAQALPSNSVLCDFVHFWRFDGSGSTNRWEEARYTAYLTFPLAHGSTNVVVERVDLGEAAPINEAVELVCQRMSAGQFAAKDLAAALQRLSQLVYAPLAPHLTNVAHLIVCPDGQLSRLPFEMLPVGNKFLLEEKTISYVTSGREIVRLANQTNSKPETRNSKSLVMGNPDFDLDLSARSRRRAEAEISRSPDQTAKPDGIRLLTSSATRALSRDYRGSKFKPLPGSGIEATNVAKLLGSDAVLRLGQDAREADLKAVVSPRVLHLATHGFFLSDQEFKHTNSPVGSPAFTRPGLPEGRTPNDWENPMVRCGIALAGANHARQITNAVAEDGLLTGLEASLLNLQGTELVILSACDSGTGEVKIGEGVMSLRRAFRIAEAESVLASHWPVSDKATSRLMTEFMRRWRAGEPRAKAWREAQLELLRSKGTKEDFSNPYFWAAFTLTGQWN